MNAMKKYEYNANLEIRYNVGMVSSLDALESATTSFMMADIIEKAKKNDAMVHYFALQLLKETRASVEQMRYRCAYYAKGMTEKEQRENMPTCLRAILNAVDMLYVFLTKNDHSEVANFVLAKLAQNRHKVTICHVHSFGHYAICEPLMPSPRLPFKVAVACSFWHSSIREFKYLTKEVCYAIQREYGPRVIVHCRAWFSESLILAKQFGKERVMSHVYQNFTSEEPARSFIADALAFADALYVIPKANHAKCALNQLVLDMHNLEQAQQDKIYVYPYLKKAKTQ